MRLQVIRPSKLPLGVNAAALLRAQLGAAGFAGDVLSDLANYPPQEPRKGERQSLGKRAGNRLRTRTTIGGGYRRTGTLGRGWRMRGPSNGTRGVLVEVRNRVPYAVYVEGPIGTPKGQRQTAEMRRRGWPAITTVARRRWAQRREVIVRILTQEDHRISFPKPR